MTGVAQRPWRGGGRSALRPGAAAAAARLTPGGSPRPGLDSRPATSSDALSSASVPGHRRKVRGTFMHGFHPNTPRVYFWLPSFFPFQEWSSFVKLYLHHALARGGWSRPRRQRGHRLPEGTECGGEDPLQAVFPIWLAVAFPNKSQVLHSGGALYYDVPCDACNGFPWLSCTQGRASLQKKVDVNQGKFAATRLQERSNPFFAVAATGLKQRQRRQGQRPGRWRQLHIVPSVTRNRRESAAASSESATLELPAKMLRRKKLRAPNCLVNHVWRGIIFFCGIYMLNR